MPRSEGSIENTYADLLRSEPDRELLPTIHAVHRDLTSVYTRQPPAGLIERVLDSDAAGATGLPRTSDSGPGGMLSLLHQRFARRPATVAVAVLTAMALAAGVGYAMHQLTGAAAAKHQLAMNGNGTPRYFLPAPESALYYPSSVPRGMAERFAGEIYARHAFGQVTGQWGMTVYCAPVWDQYPNAQHQSGMCGGAATSQSGPFQPIRVRLDASGRPAFGDPLLHSLIPHTSSSPIVVWVAMHALPPGRRYMVIAEWRAGTDSYRLRGPTVTLSGTSAILARSRNRFTALLKKGQTEILMETNASRKELTAAIATLAVIDVSQPPAPPLKP